MPRVEIEFDDLHRAKRIRRGFRIVIPLDVLAFVYCLVGAFSDSPWAPVLWFCAAVNAVALWVALVFYRALGRAIRTWERRLG